MRKWIDGWTLGYVDGKKRDRSRFLCSILGIIVLSVVLLSGCAGQEDDSVLEEGQYYLYYSNGEGTSLSEEIYTPDATDDIKIAKSMLKMLAKNTGDPKKLRTIPEDIAKGCSYSQKDKVGIVTFGSNYSGYFGEDNLVEEIVCRSSIVLTLVQLKSIQSVKFVVGNAPLKDITGKEVGLMDDRDFVDNSNNLIKSFNMMDYVLYFANKGGDQLVACPLTNVLSSDISMEQYVVDRLIKGPEGLGDDERATLSSKVKVSSVYTKDRVCYVDFDQSFLTEKVDLAEELTIYSIVNSLCELGKIDQVQILVNGDNNVLYHDYYDLSKPLIPNMELVQPAETTTLTSEVETKTGETGKTETKQTKKD